MSAKSFSFTLLTLFLMLVFISVAHAKDGDVEKRGACSKGSKWKLKLRPKSSTIEVDFDAENKVLTKQNWKIVISNNNKKVYQKSVPAGTSLGDDSNDDDNTDDSVYLFDISTIISAKKGKNNIIARATSTKTGEVCNGKLALVI